MIIPRQWDVVSMLECASLIVIAEAGRSAPAGRREYYSVRESRDGADLGRIVVDPVGWLPWRVRWHMAAYEGPENSELFTSRRAGWAPLDWDVFDPDGRLVALLRGSFVLSAGGEVLGQRRRQSPTPPGRVISPDGDRLASWERSADRREVRFSTEAAANPFLKMAIMVAALLDP